MFRTLVRFRVASTRFAATMLFAVAAAAPLVLHTVQCIVTVKSYQPSSAQFLETAILHLTLVRLDTRGDYKTQQDRPGDQPEQLHRTHMVVSSSCSLVLLLFWICS